MAINGKWLIDLEPFVNLTELKELDYELCRGFALSEYHLPTPGIRPIGLEHSPSEIEKKWKGKDEVKDMSDTQRRLFLSVYEKAAFPGRAVMIKKQDHYKNKHLDSHCVFTKNAIFFPKLLSFINKFPFKEYGRIELFVGYPNCSVPIHKDVMDENDVNEKTCDFFWLSTRGNDKKFYVLDDKNKKHYATHISWFDEKDLHGSDPLPYSTLSLRVDGIFEEEFKNKCLM
tara:strand:+ start:46179 stop:46865 length:687 start_codon:yes stop_codon:yes gene_type:complete